ncbi:hydroxyphenylacetyl-CoA thioesterase PaaI [Variovorax paradoxus]|uniref:hydroxyphenylacetyl-CoA thioesterase PaaI n=1 Tax=Variovorax paradoxus TaxID=34073 RepID=UPI001ABC2BB8
MSAAPAAERDDVADLAARCIAALRVGDRVSRDLGISLDSTGPGRISLSMAVVEKMVNAYEICHGGYIFTLADTAFAYAASTRNNVAVGMGCHIDYLRPAVKGDRLHANAVVSHAGKTTGVVKVSVVDHQGRAVAELQGRYYNVGRRIVDESEMAVA